MAPIPPRFASILEKHADALRAAERQGAEKDVPEGVRWIQMSDTCARMTEELLRLAARAFRGMSEVGPDFPEAA